MLCSSGALSRIMAPKLLRRRSCLLRVVFLATILSSMVSQWLIVADLAFARLSSSFFILFLFRLLDVALAVSESGASSGIGEAFGWQCLHFVDASQNKVLAALTGGREVHVRTVLPVGHASAAHQATVER